MLRYNGKIIAKKIVHCDTLLRKGTGLMFTSRKAVKDAAWLFPFRKPQRVAVTMIFVFYPIDLIFLDKNNKIIELKKNFRPFENYTSKEKISSFLEMEMGTIKKYNIVKGTSIQVL
jgi:uncharacterized protein